MKIKRRYILSFIICLLSATALSQNRIDSLRFELDSLTVDIPALQHEIDLSVSKISIQEFIRSMANLTDLNISIASNIKATVSNNFSKVPVKDVLLFLCREYELDLIITGNIISVVEYRPFSEEYISKPLKIEYTSADSSVSLDLRGDSSSRVAHAITEISDVNVICPPELEGQTGLAVC
ncbi:MAG: hypothetical protein U5Q03_18035 [Bacteroidota bacterium]|nr:hypothetical protein [Bacteroidota bacterium]